VQQHGPTQIDLWQPEWIAAVTFAYVVPFILTLLMILFRTQPPTPPVPAPTVPVPAPSPVASPTSSVFKPVLINAGGASFKDVRGRVWAADSYFTGGYSSADGSAFTFSGTQDQAIYQTERYGIFEYNIPLPEGSYEVIIHLSESHFDTIGQRVFDISMEGAKTLPNVDIVQFGSGQTKKALTLERPIEVKDGSLSIAFSSVVDNPKVSGIEIVKLAPHLAHAVTNGPYFAVDKTGTGNAFVPVDARLSHTHAQGQKLVSWVWKKGPKVIGLGEVTELKLPLGDNTVTLTVMDSAGDESTETTTITVQSAAFPDVSGITPNSGPVSGGNEVTITGSGFTYNASQTTVKFGLVKLTGSALDIVNQNTIKVQAPAVGVGVPVDVTVQTPVGESKAGSYTYKKDGASIDFIVKKLDNFEYPTQVAFGPVSCSA